MSCWVVPAVAAELWGVAVEDVLEAVRLGEVPSKRDLHFLLIDVAPGSPTCPPPQPAKVTVAPPTFRPWSPCATKDDVEDGVELESDVPLNWRTARESSAKQRRAPPGAGERKAA